MTIGKIDIYSRRSQEIVMVLYALRELGARHSKEEVLDFIRQHHFYELHPADKGSYQSKREWKADTLLCYGRKDAVMNDWMFHHDEKDSWELTRDGQAGLHEVILRFRRSQWQIHKCFLWSAAFKKLIDPAYIPSSLDYQRPIGRRRKTQLELAMELLIELSENRAVASKA